MKSAVSLSILMFVSLTAIGQQQRTTLNGSEGSKIILDLAAGMTLIEKSGDPTPVTLRPVSPMV